MVTEQVTTPDRQQHTYAMAATAASKETPELWNSRFGHLGYDNLFRLKKQNKVQGISTPAEDFKEQQQQMPLCEACTLSRQHRLPLMHSDSKSSSACTGARPHGCAWPLQVTCQKEERHLTTFTDDYSRLACVVPVKQTSEVDAEVRRILAALENHSGKRLKAVCTNRGRECINSELQTYFMDKGVVHCTTAPCRSYASLRCSSV